MHTFVLRREPVFRRRSQQSVWFIYAARIAPVPYVRRSRSNGTMIETLSYTSRCSLAFSITLYLGLLRISHFLSLMRIQAEDYFVLMDVEFLTRETLGYDVPIVKKTICFHTHIEWATLRLHSPLTSRNTSPSYML